MFKTATTMMTLILFMFATAAMAEPPKTDDATTTEGMKELKLEYPRPLFEGTPKNIRSANLEKIDPNKKPEPILVPDEAENVAFEKPVDASDPEPIIGELKQITDGDREGVDGSYVELGPFLQWVQIDLEDAYAVHAIALWHFHSQARVYRDVIVQLSDDPDFIMDVETVFNNDHDNSAGLGVGKDKEWIETFKGKVIPVDGVTGRYVRLYSNGNTSNEQNHYIEVEVYGVPVE